MLVESFDSDSEMDEGLYYVMSVKSSLESMLLFIYARLKIKPFVFVFVDVKFGYAHKTGEW
jgi:hypothetical protein